MVEQQYHPYYKLHTQIWPGVFPFSPVTLKLPETEPTSAQLGLPGATRTAQILMSTIQMALGPDEFLRFKDLLTGK